jgi:hypothetical protein
MDAVEFAADHHLVALREQILYSDLVTWEGGFDISYVLGEAFIRDVAPNELWRLRLTAQRAKIIGD